MASNNNELVFYQQWAVAGLQMDKYSANPWCVDSKNLDIFSDSQSVKAMAWTDKEAITNDWVDVDSKERFYLAADWRVWDSVDQIWYNHDYFDTNANIVDYSNWQTAAKALFWTPKRLFVAYSWDVWKTITIITDRLIYNIYSDWVHVLGRSTYLSWVSDNTGTTTSRTRIKFENSNTAYFNVALDWEYCCRAKYTLKAQWSDFTEINLSAYKANLFWKNQSKSFDIEYSTKGDQIVDVNSLSITSWDTYSIEFYADNYLDSSTYWRYCWLWFQGKCSTPTWFIDVRLYKKEDWEYLYPKNRNFMEIEDETYMEWLDTTQYIQLYYDSEEDLDWNVYYQFMTWNVLDFPDWYNIVAFARAFDYQYVFVNKGDMWIIYYATDENLAAWERWFRFPWMQFVNAIMIWQYVYVIADERWVRWLYVYYNWDMKKLVWADMRYTEWLNLIDWKEKYNFSWIMVNWRNNVVCATKDSVFMRWRNKLWSNVWTFILNTEWEIVDIKTERGRLDVYFTIDQTKYRKTFQDDVNIRRYEPEFEIVYPVQINSHILEKEPLKLAVSYDIPNSNTSMDVYLSVNDYHFWSFLTDWTVEPEVWDKFKVSWLSWDYWLIFVEKIWNWLTFTLDGDLPYQSSNTMNLVSEDTETTIVYTDFNHFKKIWIISKTSPQEKIGKHTLLNISNGNDLPIVRKAQVKIVWHTDNHVSPLLYDVRLLSNQYDK